MSGDLNPGSQEKYQAKWNGKVERSLKMKFPKQKFVFLTEGSGLIINGMVNLLDIIEQSKRASRTKQIDAMKPDSTIYEPMTTSSEMQTYLRPVTDSLGAAYAVVFVTPILTGDVSTSMSIGANGSMTSNPQAYYSADIQVLVWECASGKLLFSSGGRGFGSSQCFMIPQDMAIDGANSKFEKNLLNLMTRLFNYDSSKRYASILW